MATYRHIANEIVRALAVLALVFLTFAHLPGSTVAATQDTVTAAVVSSFCGDAPGDSRAHAPCHACRVGGIGLPPPPCAAILAPVDTDRIGYFSAPAAIAAVERAVSASPRGPPALA